MLYLVWRMLVKYAAGICSLYWGQIFYLIWIKQIIGYGHIPSFVWKHTIAKLAKSAKLMSSGNKRWLKVIIGNLAGKMSEQVSDIKKVYQVYQVQQKEINQN